MGFLKRLALPCAVALLICVANTGEGKAQEANLVFSAQDNPMADYLDRNILKSTLLIDNKGRWYIGMLDGVFRVTQGFSLSKKSLWEFATGGEILSTPAVDNDGVLYFGSSDNSIYALYPNGELKWSYATEGAVVSSPALAGDGTLYVGSKDGNLYALYSDGTMKWKYETGAAIYASPALADDGTVYIGSLDGTMYAVSPNGEPVWSYATDGPIYSSVAIGFSGEIVFGSTDFNVYALNPDGSLKWLVETGGMVISSPAVDENETICIGSDDGHIYRINPDGSTVWKSLVGTPVWSSPIIDLGGTIQCATSGAFRQYGELGPEVNMALQYFSMDNTGRIGMQGSSGSKDNNGTYSLGYTGNFTCGPTGQVALLTDDSGRYGVALLGSRGNDGTEDYSSWPRFRHDCRNTGNVATSQDIPDIDIAVEVPTYFCDIDGNGVAEHKDFTFMWKSVVAGKTDPTWDFNDDGRVNMGDAIQVLLNILNGRCDDSNTLLASAENPAGILADLTAEQQELLTETLASMDLTAEDRELIEAALNGVGAPATLPRAFSLEQNSPNPFNPSTTIAYEVPESASGDLRLSVHDIRGRLVRTLVDGNAVPGKHFIFWDGTDDYGRQLSSGVYLYRMQAGSFQATRKMVLLK